MVEHIPEIDEIATKNKDDERCDEKTHKRSHPDHRGKLQERKVKKKNRETVKKSDHREVKANSP
jgi:hypothetical protein